MFLTISSFLVFNLFTAGNIGTHILPERRQALRAFAESVGMPVDAMWEGVTRGGGEDGKEKGGEMDPEEALRAFAESVGRSVDVMWRGVKRGDGGEIVEIDWRYRDLKGTLPVGDMHMPYLRKLNLRGNSELKGEARVVGVTVVKFTDCFCE